MLFFQALPLLALVALLATGRAGPVVSCVIAVILALPCAWIATGNASSFGGFMLSSVVEGLWLAFIPVGIITGGLVFHAGVHHHAGPRRQGPPEDVADQLFTAAFLLGPFAESVTGFGVGAVFAVGAIRALGIAGAPAAAIGLMAQTIIPWGGLGPGTAIGAALAGIDAQALASRSAWLLAASWLLLLPLFWWWCGLAGVAVSMRRRIGQMLWLAVMGAVLILSHQVLPWQICGMLATGAALAARQLSARPPRNRADWRAAASASGPYLLLAALLMGSQLWPHPPTLHPYPGLPSLPLNHAMVSIWLAALILLVLGGRGPRFLTTAMSRARKPAMALLSFVVLARVLANAGVPVALAAGLVAGFGVWAPFASPLLAVVSGFFAGTNVGSNSAMMSLQAELGRAAGLGRAVLPGVQNGTLALVISPQLTAVAAGLAGGDVTLGRIWRIMWPVAVIALAVGTVSIVIG